MNRKNLIRPESFSKGVNYYLVQNINGQEKIIKVEFVVYDNSAARIKIRYRGSKAQSVPREDLYIRIIDT